MKERKYENSIWVLQWEHPKYGVDTYIFRNKTDADIMHERLNSFIESDDEDYDGWCEIQEKVFMEDTNNFNPYTYDFI